MDLSVVPGWVVVLALCLSSLRPITAAQDTASRETPLPLDRTKGGASILHAFEPITRSLRTSVVSFERDGKEVALGAVIDSSGLVLTKASEISAGPVEGKLSDGQRVKARILATDGDNDLALVGIDSKGLMPIEWTGQHVEVGEWAITPGLASNPEAVGIVSVPPRKIPPPKALIGVQLDFEAPGARIARIMPGFGAEKAGLKAGDIILSVNQVTITNSEALVNMLRQYREGETVKLRAKRDKEELEASVQLAVPKPDRRERRFDRQGRMNRLGGPLSQRADGFQLAFQHDTVLQPWQCGGPLVNLEGKAIGLNIARAGRTASYALPSELVQRVIATLKQELQTPVSKEDLDDDALDEDAP